MGGPVAGRIGGGPGAGLPDREAGLPENEITREILAQPLAEGATAALLEEVDMVAGNVDALRFTVEPRPAVAAALEERDAAPGAVIPLRL